MFRSLFVASSITLIAVGCSIEETTPVDAETTDVGQPTMDADASFTVTSENTKVSFVGTKKSGDSKSGGFKTVNGQIGVTDERVSSVKVVIDVESLYSEAEKLTAHLKNEDFFSAKEFPELAFSSKSIVGADEVTIIGDLTMHGQTAEIEFPATVSVTDGNVNLKAKFKVDRTQFGMNYTGQPDDPINAEVDIEISVGGE